MIAHPVRRVACPDCDLLLTLPPVPAGGSARCPRCDARLSRAPHRSIERTSALALAGLLLFVVANAFPFLTLDIQGRQTEATLFEGVRTLWTQDMPFLSVLVLATIIVAPLLHLSLLLYLLLPLGWGRRPPGGPRLFALLHHIRPWSMAEVFMLGVLVSMTKLADLADIFPGIALWAFSLLILVIAATLSTLDEEVVWARLAPRFEPTKARG
ncbi:MAG: paraquat-inducible protein A [Myxococcales bacterium]|nr:paraquat-inducible protein A [Myxococcales bacterium]